MNPYFRTVALIAASLGLVVSLFVALRDDDEGAATTSTATTPATTQGTTETSPGTTEVPPTTTAPPPATTEAPPATTEAPDRTITVAISVVGGRPEGGIRRASVRRGREVAIRVTADVSDHVHLHGYDLVVDVAPGSPAVITFTADVPGRFEVELEERGIQIADLEVRP
jgi:hypothetical protein